VVRWLALGIGIAALVVLAVAAGIRWTARLGFAALQTRGMPGFNLDLPAGEISEAGSQYRNGRLTIHKLAGVESSSLQLIWDPGGLFDDAAVDKINKGLGAVLHGEPRSIPVSTKVAIPGPEPTRSWAFRIGGATCWATQVVCGLRSVMLMTLSSHRGVERLHRRVAGSLRCRPDAAQEVTLDDIPVVFDLEPGWFPTPGDSDDLGITNGRTLLMARPITLPSAPVVDVVQTVKAWTTASGIELRDRVGDDWRIDVTQDGERLHGWVTVRDCQSSRQALVLLALAGMRDEVDRALLARGRCRKPGEPPQIWPAEPREPQTH